MVKRRSVGMLFALIGATLGTGTTLQVHAATAGAPAAPTSLAMAVASGQSLTAGTWIAQRSVVLRFTVEASSGNPVTPEVEIRRAKNPFTGRPNVSGTPVTSSGTVSLTAANLKDRRYHWQARITDSTGASPWVSFDGGKSAFRVSTHPPRVTWVDSHTGSFDPAKGPVSVHFRLNKNARVQVSVYRVGEKTPTHTVLFNHVKAKHVKTITWSGKTNRGKPVAQGKYFFALRATDPANNLARSRFGVFTLALPSAAATSIPNTSVGGKHIVISLSRQALYAYDGSRLVIQTLVTTGNPNLPTPIGNYSIMAKLSPFEFISPWPIGSPYYYPPSWTEHAMLFRSGGYYIHDAPWRSAFGPGTNGAGQPGTNYGGTHGCVNVPSGTMNLIWDWTPIGTPVEVIP